MLGFAGVLVTLHGSVAAAASLIGVVSALGAAAGSLSAFWPRRFPTIEPPELREYLMAEERITRLVLVDSYLRLIAEGRDLVRTKALRLKWSMVLLATSAVAFAF